MNSKIIFSRGCWHWVGCWEQVGWIQWGCLGFEVKREHIRERKEHIGEHIEEHIGEQIESIGEHIGGRKARERMSKEHIREHIKRESIGPKEHMIVPSIGDKQLWRQRGVGALPRELRRIMSP